MSRRFCRIFTALSESRPEHCITLAWPSLAVEPSSDGFVRAELRRAISSLMLDCEAFLDGCSYRRCKGRSAAWIIGSPSAPRSALFQGRIANPLGTALGEQMRQPVRVHLGHGT